VIESNRKGMHFAGIRGSLQRFPGRNALVVDMRLRGMSWAQIGAAIGITRKCARKVWLRAQARAEAA
jgi:hypothetical protein